MREDNVYVFTTTKIMFPLTRSQKEEGINISDIFLQLKLTFFLKNQLFSTVQARQEKNFFHFSAFKINRIASSCILYHEYYTEHYTFNFIYYY